MKQTKGMALEDVAEVFGDAIVLSDSREEQIHQRFKESHYNADALHEETKATQVAVHMEQKTG